MVSSTIVGSEPGIYFQRGWTARSKKELAGICSGISSSKIYQKNTSSRVEAYEIGHNAKVAAFQAAILCATSALERKDQWHFSQLGHADCKSNLIVEITFSWCTLWSRPGSFRNLLLQCTGQVSQAQCQFFPENEISPSALPLATLFERH